MTNRPYDDRERLLIATSRTLRAMLMYLAEATRSEAREEYLDLLAAAHAQLQADSGLGTS